MSKLILCGKCLVQVTTVPDPKPDDKVTCPSCGDTDTFKNVLESLGEQTQEWATKKIFEGLDKTAWKLTPSSAPKRKHRFIVKLD
jgi:hypothetical protein